MRVSLLLFALSLVAVSSAQSLPGWAEPSVPGAGSGGVSPSPMASPPTTAPPTPSIVPVDGGLGLLALAGGAYAVARLRRREG